jgi:hypothetical protein
MGRIYTVAFENVAVSAVQDFFEVTPADDKPVRLLWARITNVVTETSEQLRIRIKRLPATVTSGSGGSSPTIQKATSSDASAGFAAEANNTTQATTSSTAQVLWAEGFNVLSGWDYLPTPETVFTFVQGEALIIDLPTAPGASINMSGTICIEELG